MPENLDINARFVATGVESGMNDATAAVSAGADQMAQSLNLVDRGAARAERQMDRMAQSTRGLSRDTQSTEYAMRYAAIRAEAYGGKLGGLGYVMARLGTASQGIFLGLAAALGAVVAVHLGEAFQRWYDNAVLLKGAIHDLTAANEKLSVSGENLHAKLLGKEAELAKLRGDTSAYLSLTARQAQDTTYRVAAGVFSGKGGQAALDQLHHLGIPGRTVINQLQEPHRLKNLESRYGPEALKDLQRTDALLSRLEGELRAARQGAAAERMGGPQGAGLGAEEGGGLDAASLAKQVTALKKLRFGLSQSLYNLQQAEESVGVSAQIRSLQAAKEGARGAHGHPTETLDRLMRSSHSQAVAQARKELEQLKAQEREQEKEQKKNEAETTRLAKATDALTASEAKLGQTLTAGYFEQQGRETKKNLAVMEETNRRVTTGNVTAIKAGKENVNKVSNEMFGGLNRALDESMKGVMMGTENMTMAWRRMGANMLLSTIESFAQIELVHAEHWATTLMLQSTAKATGAAIDKAADTQSILGSAKKAAAGAFSDVMGLGIPPPLNFALAVAAAGAAFAGGMAYAAFAQGGIVPATGPALLHQHEMVLPAHIAQHVMATAGGGGGSAGGHTQINISALDGADAHSVLTRNRDSVASSLQRALRSRNMIQ